MAELTPEQQARVNEAVSNQGAAYGRTVTNQGPQQRAVGGFDPEAARKAETDKILKEQDQTKKLEEKHAAEAKKLEQQKTAFEDTKTLEQRKNAEEQQTVIDAVKIVVS